MTCRRLASLAAVCLLIAGCYTSRPAYDPSPKPPTQEGTLAGHVTSERNEPLSGRIVRATPLDGGEPFETTTDANGAYTMKIPPGRYRLEVVIQSGERLVRGPKETNINPSDLDPDRDFVIGRAQ